MSRLTCLASRAEKLGGLAKFLSLELRAQREPAGPRLCLILRRKRTFLAVGDWWADSLARQLLNPFSTAERNGRLTPTARRSFLNFLGARESFTVIREASNLSLPLSGVVGNPQARNNYLTVTPALSREAVASPLDKITPLESVEAEISRLTWAVIDGIATPADRDRLSVLVSEQHEFRRV